MILGMKIKLVLTSGRRERLPTASPPLLTWPNMASHLNHQGILDFRIVRCILLVCISAIKTVLQISRTSVCACRTRADPRVNFLVFNGCYIQPEGPVLLYFIKLTRRVTSTTKIELKLLSTLIWLPSSHSAVATRRA